MERTETEGKGSAFHYYVTLHTYLSEGTVHTATAVQISDEGYWYLSKARAISVPFGASFH